MLRRLEQHALEIQPVGLLCIRALRDRDARGAQALRELVPDALQLAEIEQAGVATAGARLVEPAHSGGGHERIGQLALEPGDLGPHRAASDPSSVVRDRRIRNRYLQSADRLLDERHDSLLWLGSQITTRFPGFRAPDVAIGFGGLGSVGRLVSGGI